MSLPKNKLLWASLLGVLLSGGLLLLAGGYLGLVVFAGVLSGTPVVDLLLDVAVPALTGVGFLLAALIVSGVALTWTLVRSASRWVRRLSLPKSRRASTFLAWIEYAVPPLRGAGLSDRVAPPEPSPGERAERALADLKRRYVDDEITEAEFERKVDRVVATESTGEVRVARERDRLVDETPNRH